MLHAANGSELVDGADLIKIDPETDHNSLLAQLFSLDVVVPGPLFASNPPAEGEDVTIELSTPSGVFSCTVYANWMKDAAGVWCASFYTFNSTWLYAYATDNDMSSWLFFTADGRCVDRDSFESSTHGLYGPAGISSNWKDHLDESIWY